MEVRKLIETKSPSLKNLSRHICKENFIPLHLSTFLNLYHSITVNIDFEVFFHTLEFSSESSYRQACNHDVKNVVFQGVRNCIRTEE